jgi:hypothetical protein
MSIQPVPELPGLLHVHRHADNHNGDGVRFYPDSQFFQQAVATKAHCVAFARKLLFSKHYILGTAGGMTGVTARWYCETGPACKRIYVMCVLGLDDRDTADEPSIDVAITRIGTGATTTMEFHGGESTTAATDAPEEFIIQGQVMDASPSEAYSGTVTHNNDARLISILVYEDQVATVDSGNPPHQTWEPSAGSPIMDDDVSRLLDGVGDMMTGLGGLRFDWSPPSGGSRARLSATWVNLLDDASTSPPTAAHPSFVLNTTARNTISKTTVPIRFAVYAAIAGGGSGTVSLRNTGGTDVAVATVTAGAPAWVTVTGTVAVNSSVRYAIGYASDGVNSLTVYAVSLYEDG